MDAANSAYVFNVSEYLFRLMTEAVRLSSNEAGRFTSLACVIGGHASAVRDGFQHHDVDTLRGHFATIPTSGDIRVDVPLAACEMDDLCQARLHLTARLGGSWSDADAVSALLFDYVVERKTRELLDKLGIGEAASGRGGTGMSPETQAVHALTDR